MQKLLEDIYTHVRFQSQCDLQIQINDSMKLYFKLFALIYTCRRFYTPNTWILKIYFVPVGWVLNINF